MRRLALTAALLAAIPAAAVVAQDSRPGQFDSYDDFEGFVTRSMASGDLVGLLGSMTDLSQLTVAQRAQLDQEMASGWPVPLPNSGVMVDERLGEFSREIRAFWTDDRSQYGFFYAYIHRIDTGEIQVMHFGISRDITETFKLF